MDSVQVRPESVRSGVRTAVLISGRGSNMMALVNAAEDRAYPAEIALVISNRPGAAGINWAAKRGVPTSVIDHTAYRDRCAFDDALNAELVRHGVELVALAGFMRVLTPAFVERWLGRIVNIHPSLLPAFRGLSTHARAIEAGHNFSGCTVHFVEPELDAGPTIVQAQVAIDPDDTPETLAERVLVQEHRIYPLALAWVASGQVRLTNARVQICGDLGHYRDLIIPAANSTAKP